MPAADLPHLLEEVSACRHCVERPTGKPLPQAPRPVLRVSPTARILIAGQAPGTRVHASGIPFTDPSGVRLRAWLALDDATFYDVGRIAILPMGFCFPGQDARGADLPPRKECAPLWRARVLATLPAIELVLAIGMYAQRWHLGPAGEQGIGDAVAGWRQALSVRRRPRVVAMPHPSWRNNGWLRQRPWFEAEMLPALRAEVRRLLESG